MAVPPKADPRWKRLLTDDPPPELKGLATKLTVSRMRRDVRQDPAALDAALDEIIEFYTNNPFSQREYPAG